MSLIVAKKLASNFIIMSDTKLTPSNNSRKSYRYGTIKSIIVNPQLCISFAGNEAYAEDAFYEIKDGEDKNRVIEILIKHHIQNNYETEFLACFGYPNFELVSIKNGIAENVDFGWVGSGFDKYQYYYHNQEGRKLVVELNQLKIIKLPDNVDEICRSVYSNMFNGLLSVIEDSNVPEVGGFIIPIIYQNNGFEYYPYTYVFSQPVAKEELPEGKWVNISWGNAANGGFCANFIGLNNGRVAIHFFHGNVGILYERSDYSLLYPQVYIDQDEIDFIDMLRLDSSTQFAALFNHHTGHFANKGFKMLKNQRYEDAIRYFDRGIILSSTTWEVPSNSDNNYRNLSDFLSIKGSAQIGSDEAEILKKMFFYRGIAYKMQADFELALLDMRQVISIDPSWTEAFIEKAIILHLLNRNDDAIKTISEYIEKEPSDDCYYIRGNLYLSIGDLSGAQADFIKSLSINPYHQPAKECLTHIARLFAQEKREL